MTLPVTLTFIAIFTLIFIPMSMVVGLYRGKSDIRFLHGGDEQLLRRIRAHGNFAEYVPMAMLAMGAAEISGTPAWVLWLSGLVLLVGRVMHYSNIRGLGWGPARIGGMMMTMLPMAVLALSTLLFQFR